MTDTNAGADQPKGATLQTGAPGAAGSADGRDLGYLR